MKKVCAYILLLVFSVPGFGEVQSDSFYQLAAPDIFSPYSMIERGNLKDANGLLFSPVCAGQLQSPALITDLYAFFAGYAGTRVVDRGNGHFLLMQKPAFTEKENLQTMSKISNTVYAELDFNSSIEGAFLLRGTSAFFTATGAGTTTCQASTIHGMNYAKS